MTTKHIRLDSEAIERVESIRRSFRQCAVPVKMSATSAVNAALAFLDETIKRDGDAMRAVGYAIDGKKQTIFSRENA